MGPLAVFVSRLGLGSIGASGRGGRLSRFAFVLAEIFTGFARLCLGFCLIEYFLAAIGFDVAANGFPKVRFGVAWLRRRISERVVLINFVVVAEILAGFCLRFLRRGTPSGVFALVHVGVTVPGMKMRAFPALASTILLQWSLVVSLMFMLQVSVY